jgi:hypothetical protein
MQPLPSWHARQRAFGQTQFGLHQGPTCLMAHTHMLLRVFQKYHAHVQNYLLKQQITTVCTPQVLAVHT